MKERFLLCIDYFDFASPPLLKKILKAYSSQWKVSATFFLLLVFNETGNYWPLENIVN